MRRYKMTAAKLLGWGAIAVVAAISLTPLVHAVSTITEGYSSADTLSIGSLVSLKKNSSDEVVAASIESVDNLLGIVVNSDSALLSVSNGGKSQVQVATSGTVPVLVSDINGEIKRGDHITASPLTGVGMKATGNVRIIGIAQGDMGAGTKETYKEKSGAEKSANLSQIPVLVNVAYYFKQPEKTIIPSSIQNVANALAGKEVKTLPILVSGGIFLITMVVVMSIIYSMIRSSIISIGRNPMSQAAIYRDLLQLSALVLVILTIGVASIYMVLTKL